MAAKTRADDRGFQMGLENPSDANMQKERQFVTALARGLEILRCFSVETPLMGNQDIARKTGLPKPTVSRLTYTLTELGFLRYSKHLRKYQLGTAVLALGYNLFSNRMTALSTSACARSWPIMRRPQSVFAYRTACVCSTWKIFIRTPMPLFCVIGRGTLFPWQPPLRGGLFCVPFLTKAERI